MNLPHVAFGTGFTLPPVQGPFPAFRREADEDRTRRAQTEIAILSALNVLAHENGQPAYTGAHEIFRLAKRRLVTWPELDHYGRGKSDEFVGPLPTAAPADGDVNVDWPAGHMRATGYLQPDYPYLAAVLSALERSGISSIVAIPNGHLWAQQFNSRTLRVLTKRARFDQLLSDADFVTCHGSHNLVVETLQLGKPLLLLPQQIEQAMLARRIQEADLGMCLSPTQHEDLPATLDLMKVGKCKESSRNFAVSKRGYDISRATREIAMLAEALA